MKIRQNSKKFSKYLRSLPRIYMVGFWAKAGVRDYACVIKHGKMLVTKQGEPYVWDYYDGNGTCDEWHLIPISHTTTGYVYCYTTNQNKAKYVANAINKAQKDIVMTDIKGEEKIVFHNVIWEDLI